MLPVAHMGFACRIGIAAMALGGLGTPAFGAPVSLGLGADYTLTATGSAFDGAGSGGLLLGAASQVLGNVAARENSSGIGPASTISGRFDAPFATIGPGVSINGTANANFTHLTPYPSQLGTDIAAASAAALGLAADVIVDGDIATSQTLSRTDAVTVYRVNGNISLLNGLLTLSGSATDQFVINVSGFGVFSGASPANRGGVVLAGGLQAENVLFNFYGGTFAAHAQSDVTFSNNSDFQGNLLAPNRFLLIGDGVGLDGARMMTAGVQANLQRISPPEAPAVVPLPAAAWLLVWGLAALGVIGARNRRVATAG